MNNFNKNSIYIEEIVSGGIKASAYNFFYKKKFNFTQSQK
jgi:hypothetical protein